MNFCSQCGQPVAIRIPAGDNRPRAVCTACNAIHYENPKVVVGCIPEHEGRVLLCRRAIEPRSGYWTMPAGFLEIGESLAEGAVRETWEEARARVDIGTLLAVVDIVHAGQVHVFYSGRLAEPGFAPGEESLETRLFHPAEIPWPDLAFASVRIALEHYVTAHLQGDRSVRLATAPRRHRD
jgi:ADP-ribose pyrophosphatase YjhB (NUDIX family)